MPSSYNAPMMTSNNNLTRADQDRQLDQLLLEGLRSGPVIEPDESYWEEKKDQLREGG